MRWMLLSVLAVLTGCNWDTDVSPDLSGAWVVEEDDQQALAQAMGLEEGVLIDRISFTGDQVTLTDSEAGESYDGVFSIEEDLFFLGSPTQMMFINQVEVTLENSAAEPTEWSILEIYNNGTAAFDVCVSKFRSTRIELLPE
ncbi:MAG TPA: hypothetical protein DCR93_32690 [Cytophagales bacterium]|nr:hypothetical protein [Cytophagales bacterium]HAP64046.1 hypothetical protein [Cytophagales bacterium]